MNYKLHCEGFPLDEDLRDKLLLCGRKLVLKMGIKGPVQMSIKQINGLVQSRVELELPSRRVSALVRRKDPEVAMQAAIDALHQALDSDLLCGAA